MDNSLCLKSCSEFDNKYSDNSSAYLQAEFFIEINHSFIKSVELLSVLNIFLILAPKLVWKSKSLYVVSQAIFPRAIIAFNINPQFS
mmetsp:Transcript_3173/g.2645  ORF Transcript_3173/g.2645 Transcript_3173/m.2645 type:complete len:87 (+) Transcript_3173:855-1115(+)